jgi:hypothetical protein
MRHRRQPNPSSKTRVAARWLRAKPRSDVIVRRFIAGESISDLGLFCIDKGMAFLAAHEHVESCIRRELNRKRARR